jgi:hypothetical protein
MFKSSTVSPASARNSQTRISPVQKPIYTLEVSATFVLLNRKVGTFRQGFLFLPLWSKSLTTVTGFVVHI